MDQQHVVWVKAAVCLFGIASFLFSQEPITAGADTLTTASPTASPLIIDYQGFLSNTQGRPISGAVTCVFSIWDMPEGGVQLWQETQALDVHLGYFTAHLGGFVAMPPALFNGDCWLQVAVNGEVMLPRKHINRVALAAFSDNAAALGGLPAAEYYSKAQADSHSKNKIDAFSLGGVVAGGYVTHVQGDAKYLIKGALNSVSGEMIVDGSIQRKDLAFDIGSGGIGKIIADNGLEGGGSGSEVRIGLNGAHQSGQAYDGRFVKRGEANSVTGAMIADGTITSIDIQDGSIQPKDMSFTVGTVNGVLAGEGLAGGGTIGTVTLALNDRYRTGSSYDTRFIVRGEPNAVTSAMIRDGEITSADIRNGTIQPEDMAFAAGDITAVIASGGIDGGGTGGDVRIQLASAYATGVAYNSMFVNENQTDAVTGAMIRDGEVRGNDIAGGAISGAHLANGFFVQQNQPANPVITVANQAASPTAAGVEGRGYVGVRGVGSQTGVYGEGAEYGVYARATDPTKWGLYVEGKAFCTSGAWGDLAELVPLAEAAEPGDVVVIDDHMRFKLCDREGDARVAGVVSTAPTMIVGDRQAGANYHPLALAGIVPCKVVADRPINPGDLLTTSSRRGYAQKAVNPQVGTILGKALEALPTGVGVIRVLITLQ